MKGNNAIPRDINNILLIQLGDIGDVVLSLPSIRALRENFPRANVIVTVREKAAELIEDCPWATGVISISKGRRRLTQQIAYQKDFFSRLRIFRFDLAIDMRTGTRGAVLAFFSGAPQRVGFYAEDGKLWRNRVFTHLAYLEGRPGQHMAQYYLNLLFAYDLKTENIYPEIHVPVEKQRKAAALLKEENIPPGSAIIAIQPFSLWKYKEWGVPKYISLIKWITSEYKCPLIITGSPDERERAEGIMKVCGNNNLSNLAGKTSIGMFAALLKACALFIGGDSAGIHIAAAVGTPTVGIFGPFSSAAWAPRGKRHVTVQKALPCVPCHQKGCHDSEISRCLEELTVDEAKPAVKGQMEKLVGV